MKSSARRTAATRRASERAASSASAARGTARIALLLAPLCAVAACASAASREPGGAERAAPGSDALSSARSQVPELRGFAPRGGSAEFVSGSYSEWRLEITEREHVHAWSLTLQQLGGLDAGGSELPTELTLTEHGVARRVYSSRAVALVGIREVAHADSTFQSVWMPVRLLAQGVYDAAELALRRTSGASGEQAPDSPGERELDAGGELARDTMGGLAPDEERRLTESIGLLMLMMMTIRKHEQLEQLLWKIVEKPSLWSVVSNLGIDVHLSVELQHARATASGLPGELADLPALCIPLELRVNGAPALVCDATVVPPLPPLHVCGGIVRIDGRHPSDPSRCFSLRLVGAGGARADVGALVR